MKISRIDPFSPGGEGVFLPPSSFLQTPFWAGFKAGNNWEAHYFLVDGNRLLSVLVRTFSGIASIAYIPLGPDLPCDDPAGQSRLLTELAHELAPLLPPNTVFIRFDPPWGTVNPNNHGEDDGEASDRTERFPEAIPKPAVRAPACIQPPDTVIMDLSLSPETLLSQMKPKWRYNIRLGEKKGLEIRCLEDRAGAGEGIDVFYGLYIETARRDGIAIHSKAYYSKLVTRAADYAASVFDKPVSVRVYVAEYEGSAIASIITLFCGDEAIYLYGASSNENRNLMPAYSLQWKAIRDAIGAGCKKYDFYGIPPTDDPAHPMHGLYRFKTGFGGSIVHRTGSWDIPLKPLVYSLYRIAERLRSFWFKKAVKSLRGILRSS